MNTKYIFLYLFKLVPDIFTSLSYQARIQYQRYAENSYIFNKTILLNISFYIPFPTECKYVICNKCTIGSINKFDYDTFEIRIKITMSTPPPL